MLLLVTILNVTAMFKPPYLQAYKGISTRHNCPECGIKQCFTLYLDGNTDEPIHRTVGKCNRESKCGYHYTPKQFFMDNPTSSSDVARNFSTPPLGGGREGSKPTEPTKPMGTIPFKYVELSAGYQSNFVRFLCEILTDEQIHSVGDKYAIGRTKANEVIFWQIDITGKVRTGKIMQYNPETGKRIKHESGAIDWVHNKLKQMKQLPDDYNLQQCFFGEHLLNLYPAATVAIVESEKSAIIASAVMPDIIWLAAGNINGLTIEKCNPLAGRNIILFPDLGAYDKWNLKSIEIQKQLKCKIDVSNHLEKIATTEEKEKGLDIADYMIAQLRSQLIQQSSKIKSRFSKTLQSFMEQSKALSILVNRLQLEEV